jgi:hypothetical protein
VTQPRIVLFLNFSLGFLIETLGDNHRCSVDGIIFDGGERLVGLLQREYSYLGLQLNFGGDFEKVARVGSRHVGDAAYLALSPEKVVVVEFRNPVEMNCIDGDDASLSQASYF